MGAESFLILVAQDRNVCDHDHRRREIAARLQPELYSESGNADISSNTISARRLLFRV